MIEHVLEGCQCEGKRCTKCEEVKCIGLFNKHKIGAGGLHAACRACSSMSNKAHYQKNRERIIAKHATWRNIHPDYHKLYYQEPADILNVQSRDYQREYATEISNQKKIYYREHTEEILELRKEYQKTHAEIYAAIDKAHFSRRRSRKTQAGGSYTPQQWRDLKRQYNSTCLRCGRRESEIKLTADHVIPITRNGTSDISNIQPLCYSCNSKKYNKIIDYRIGKENRNGE